MGRKKGGERPLDGLREKRNHTSGYSNLVRLKGDQSHRSDPRSNKNSFEGTKHAPGVARHWKARESSQEVPHEMPHEDLLQVVLEGPWETWREKWMRTFDRGVEAAHAIFESSEISRPSIVLTYKPPLRLLKDTTPLQRGIIRHLIVVLDLSSAMTEKDLRPSRFLLTIRYAEEFVTEYFEQNPISQLGFIGMRDGLAIRISDISGNPSEHIAALQSLREKEPIGDASLQNALEMARGALL